MRNIKIVYMGTPDFAAPCLAALVEAGAQVCCVVTQPDKPTGRKQILTPSPVKRLAVENHLTVFQPASMKSDEAYEYIKSFAPDFIVVAAYGKILPKRVLDIPKIACVNVHGSILPKYRGAAPIQWAVINGEKETGITTMKMNEGIDTGDILLTTKTEIGENETAGELFDRLATLSRGILLETLQGLLANRITPIPQCESDATYTQMLTKEAAQINWRDSCQKIRNFIRGMNPWPCAYTIYQEKKYKIFACEVTNLASDAPVGTLYAESGCIYAVCGDGVLHLNDIQADGCKRMSDKAFLNGHSL